MNVHNIFWITLVHLLALAAIPFFSYSALGVALFGIFFLAPWGINVGYHRLLSHRSFTSPPLVRNVLVTLGAALGAGPPLQWAAMHRVHHRYSDTPLDPHNSERGFWYSHILHLFEIDERQQDKDYLSTYAPDLLLDPYLAFLERFWLVFALASLALLYFLGGVSWLMWGGFVRLTFTWHIMWFVNSATHKWGYRNYDGGAKAVNCWWVGLLAAGEGWHNNHHAKPSCAAHGHRWWEVDQSFLFIRLLEAAGLATEVKRPAKLSS